MLKVVNNRKRNFNLIKSVLTRLTLTFLQRHFPTMMISEGQEIISAIVVEGAGKDCNIRGSNRHEHGFCTNDL
jgi:hypothetical protein